ncbi:MAG: hypothetical protein KJ787_12875 [Gammaproteobacteria bacterium]|nr:hypothetical protein [Gammaproteobacteria bacterium]MBU1647217.1 hypothetical protein [Gammaproteobacteria bacterium]MBU1972729.1 hypothetical protein [Gammaproteobacteria bacterium]
MTPADALVAFDRKILETYSRRTASALGTALPLRMALPRIESFLALNVAKEVRKDALVIRQAGGVSGRQSVPDAAVLRQLYEATLEVDSDFLARIGGFPVGIVIRYEEIEPIRLRRIGRLYRAAQMIVEDWSQQGGGRAALRSRFTRGELETLVYDLLQLYALETQALSRSLRLPGLLTPLREGIARSLYRVMIDTAGRLAREVATVVHRPGRN